MRDGVFAARKGLPAVAIVTDDFIDQGTMIARALGMPGIPRAAVEHPIAGSGLANLQRVATELAPRLIEALQRK